MTSYDARGVDPYLVARLGAPKFSSGLEVRFDCPCERCAGRKDQKLYVNFTKGAFHCIRSGWGGRIDYLYKFLGISRELRHAPENLREAIGFSEHVALEELEDVQEITIPKTTQDWKWSDADEWLKFRLASIPPEEIEELKSRGVIRRGFGRYWDRVFFVDIYGRASKVRYWTARTYLDAVSPKYLNPYNVPRTKVLGNQNRVEEEYTSEVIICEGPISAIVAGQNAVWTYGRVVTTEQIALLDSLPCSRFIIASEPDLAARKNSLELARVLTQARRDVDIVSCPEGTDPASLGRDTFRRLVAETAERYSFSTEVSRRLALV